MPGQKLQPKQQPDPQSHNCYIVCARTRAQCVCAYQSIMCVCVPEHNVCVRTIAQCVCAYQSTMCVRTRAQCQRSRRLWPG